MLYNKLSMGALNTITKSYSYGQYLYWYIERNDLPNVEKVLKARPDLLNASITANSKTTPLHRAAANGNLPLAQMLIEEYQADVDGKTTDGETPLIGAVKREKTELVRYLLVHNANLNAESGCGLRAIDYAIIFGYYNIALLLYSRMNEEDLKDKLDYEMMAAKFNRRYVNYSIFLDNLKLKVEEENVPDFLTKPKVHFEDPVVDPRETWKNWLIRNLQFKDPPLCERSELPEELQPQNRRFGKVRHYLSTLAMTHMTQKPSFMPGSENQSENRMKGNNELKEHDAESIKSI